MRQDFDAQRPPQKLDINIKQSEIKDDRLVAFAAWPDEPALAAGVGLMGDDMVRVRPKTLVETLIVVGLIGLLAAASVPALIRARNDAVARCLALQLRYLQGQIDLYMARHGNLPPITAAGWTPLVLDGSLRELPTNPAWSWIDPGPSTVEVVGTPGVRGSAEAAWVWNSVDRVIAASCFDETRARITGAPGD